MYCVCCVRSSPAGTVTHDDILDITEAIAEDGRYKALDRMDADRKLLLFQVSFPIKLQVTSVVEPAGAVLIFLEPEPVKMSQLRAVAV